MAKQKVGVYDRVLECAKEEFLSRGFLDASLRTIAQEAETSTGSIYTRFGDKEGLFRALAEPVVDEFKAMFRKVQEDFHQFPEEEQIRELERVVLLKVIDQKWMDHIDDMDQLREGIGLQAYGQRDPKVEYKMAAYDMFNEMLESIQQDTVRLLFHVRVEQKVEREQVAKVTGTNKDESGPRKPVQRAERKIYPNDPCPCGSGKKYKQCCGRKPV